MQRIFIIGVFILGLSVVVSGQDTWNLLKCVDYAIENNIDLNETLNDISTQEINYFESKASVLPSLNTGTYVDFNFGRNVDDENNVTFDQSLNHNIWIDASVDLFRGFVKYNNMAYNKYVLAAMKQGAEQERNRLVLSVLNAYYTVLYSSGLANVASNQVALSELQYLRMAKLVEVGKESPITMQELKSQWASDKLSLTKANNMASTNLLELKQLLRLNANQPFEIDSLNLNSMVISDLPEVDSVYDQAFLALPDIKYQELMVKASEKDLAMAKGYISPRLYLLFGYNTGFYNTNDNVYKDQISNNQNQMVRLGISVPLFNGASTYSSIKRKQISVINQNLKLEKGKEELYTQIWNSLNDLQSALNEYESSVELNDYSQLAFNNVAKKLEKGIASATDYEASKQRLVSAQANLLKAKLIYMMRKQMLDFYLSGNWNHL